MCDTLRFKAVQMSGDQPTHVVLSFGPFEADLQTQELKKQGVLLHLPGQSFQILTMLLQSPGQLVSREKLKQALWPTDTFVDFEKGTNAAINRLRETLGDSAENPRYIETLPRRGYRLIVAVTGAPTVQQPPAEVSRKNAAGWRRQPYFGLLLLGALIVALGAFALWKAVVRTSTAPKVLRFTKLTNDGQTKGGPLATDGSRVYFSEVVPGPRNTALQVSVRGGEAVPLAVPLKQPYVLDLSSDGTELLIANAEGDGVSVWVQPVTGGSPQRIGNVLAHDARFAANASTILYGRGSDVYSVSRNDPSPRKLFTVGGAAFSFRYSPGARVFRFTVFDSLVDDMNIMEAATDGTGLHKMFQGCNGRWSPDGRFFIFQSRTDGRLDVWVLPQSRRFPWERRNDKPIQLTSGPLNFEEPLPSKDGKQIFAIGSFHRAELVRYDSRSGQFVPYLAGISAEGVEFSRDGQWVAYISFPEGTLWRSKVDGTERLQLTFLPMRASSPRWSPDNTQIAFDAALPGAPSNIYLVSSEGGTAQRVLPSEQSQAHPNWSPDGKSLVFGTGFVPNMPIYSIDLESKQVSTLRGSDGLSSPRESPDGRYIVATRTTSPSSLMLFDVTNQKWTEVSGLEAGFPSWSHDGKYIYFQVWRSGTRDFHQRVVRLRLSNYKIEDVADVKNVGRLTTGTFIEWFGIAPDDSPLFARDISTSEIYALEMDWP
jgi:Tol biopolymer transport system component/DNA-binding winged helix-turn-helix (wHTH) protein